ncbi:MAG: hypothetical protein ACP5JG_08360 [Anaerolineae bacterium]
MTMRRLLKAWWPLAAGQMLMTLGSPARNSVMSRLPRAEINLAAWGGIVFPMALIMSAPVIMLISTANTLITDLQSYRKLRRFMLILSLGLVAVHATIALTPLYEFFARQILGAPEETIDPGRIGMIIIIPWAWALAFRRFHQGLMISYNHSKAVGLGTLFRLGAIAIALAIGFALPGVSGIVVGAGATVAGVVTEAVYAGLRARPIIKHEIPKKNEDEESLTQRQLLAFYLPLIATSYLTIVVQPIRSAAINRMPAALASQAVWPVVGSLMRLLRSPAFALRETTVSLLEEPRAFTHLRKFTIAMAAASLGGALLVTATPLAEIWLRDLMALQPNLIDLGRRGLWFAILIPAAVAGISLYQGTLTHVQQTRAITEAMALYLLVITAVLGTGMLLQRYDGLYVTVAAFSVGRLAQVGWLWWRSRPYRREYRVQTRTEGP